LIGSQKEARIVLKLMFILGDIPSLAIFEGLGFKEVSKRLRLIIKRGDSH